MTLDADLLAREARELLASDHVTTPTRRALQARLDWKAPPPRVLTPTQLQTLHAVAARLIPLPELDAALDLARRLEAQLADGPGDGWRYATMPSDTETQQRALDALDRDAGAAHGAPFADLPSQAQDALLADAQSGAAQDWPVDPARWFEETLAALAEIAYAHPLLQLAIGYDGMADARGWQDAAPGG